MSNGNKNLNNNVHMNLTKDKQSNSNRSKKYIMEMEKENKRNLYFLIPLVIILGIIPFIVRLKLYNPNLSQFPWFADSEYQIDTFLYYKQWFLIGTTGIMALIIIGKAYIDRKAIRFLPIFIPLAVYALLCLLSSTFSSYSSFSFSGGFEQFESLFAQLAYCLIVYYAFLFVKSGKDIRFILLVLLISVLIMSILGFFQFMGHDFFTTEFGKHLYIPEKYRANTNISFVFGDSRVYLTLYNPNYVGVYAALLLPILMVLLIFERNIFKIIMTILTIIGISISIIGSNSLAGIIGIATALLCIVIFLWRYLLKRFYIVIPVTVILVVILFALNNKTNSIMLQRIEGMFNIQKIEYPLSGIETNDDNVSLIYNGNKMYISVITNDSGQPTIKFLDENQKEIAYAYNDINTIYTVTDERFAGITVGYNLVYANTFTIQVNGVNWNFLNTTGDGTYYYVNRFGKPDKIRTAPTALLTGYESIASGRGYIWSRTIPLIKKYFLLGSGSDTFAMAFPQQDYVNMYQFGFGNDVITKPHCLYLQIAIQSGLLSLIAFLVFYIMYFISSLGLYFRGRFNNYYAKVGVAIFIGTIAYMITGFSNDSSITTAPIFWTLIGIGIAVNLKAKPLLIEERAAIKVARQEKLEAKAELKNKVLKDK